MFKTYSNRKLSFSIVILFNQINEVLVSQKGLPTLKRPNRTSATTPWKTQLFIRRCQTQLDSNKQKIKLIKLTGATATNAAPNKPSDKTKQQTLNKQNQDLTVKAHKAQLPTGTSLFYVWVSHVNSPASSLFFPPFLLSLTLPLAQSPVSSSMWLTAQICGHDLYLRGWLWMLRPWAVELWSSHRYPHTVPGHLLTEN